MIIKGRGIILSQIKYGDSSIIVRTFCEDLGHQSFLVNGVRTKKAKLSAGIFQPLSLIDFVAYFQTNKSLHRIQDAKASVALNSLYTNMHKCAIGMFLGEVLAKVLPHEPNEHLSMFEYVWSSVQTLETQTKHFENFHIKFLIGLTPYMGFGIEKADDLQENNPLPHHLSAIIQRFISEPSEAEIPLTGEMRFEILETIIRFYRAHIHPLGEIKSLKVLQRIFH